MSNPKTWHFSGLCGLFFPRIIIAYWLAAILLTTLVLVSLDYDLGEAGVMSLTFLPAALALSFFLPRIDRTKSRRDRILDSIFIILGVMSMTFLLIFTIHRIFIFSHGYNPLHFWTVPAMLQNPVFVAGILAVLAYGHFRLVRWLNERFPSTKPITFFSDYRKISLSRDDILYIESRDSEVWVFARDGQSYRNRNGITQWENLLGEGFLRIHRAFLVNVSHATLSTPDTVLVDGKERPVSRKKKDTVKAVLRA